MNERREKIVSWIAITFVTTFLLILLAFLMALCWRIITNVYADSYSPPTTTTTVVVEPIAVPATLYKFTPTTSTSTTSTTTTSTTSTTLPPQGMSFEPVQTAPPVEVAEAPAPTIKPSTEQIIRNVWPDNLEARALRIAYRESRYECCVRTWCCFGVFQIYWQLHREWLADIGITDVSQLYNPTLNVKAAYALYQRAGWEPWQT